MPPSRPSQPRQDEFADPERRLGVLTGIRSSVAECELDDGHPVAAPRIAVMDLLTQAEPAGTVDVTAAEPGVVVDLMAPAEPGVVIDLTPAEPHVVIDLRDGVAPTVYAEPEVVEPPVGTDVDPGWIMLVGSSGGHLAQLVALQPWWTARERRWVTFQTPDAESLLTGEHVTWAHFPTTRNVRNLVRNAVLSARMLRKDRPAAIITTGAGVALPFFMIGRLLGIPTVYIEVYDRIDSRTLTARLCRPFTSQMLVQWEEQQALYPHATLVGTLL